MGNSYTSKKPCSVWLVKGVGETPSTDCITDILEGEGIYVSGTKTVKVISLLPPRDDHIGGVKRKDVPENAVEIDPETGEIFVAKSGVNFPITIEQGGTGKTNREDALLALLPDILDQNGKVLGVVNGAIAWVDKGGITPEAAEAIAQANFNKNIEPVNRKIVVLENDINSLIDYTGIELVILIGGSFGTLTNQEIFNHIYDNIPTTGSSILIPVMYNGIKIFLSVPITKSYFLELIDLYNFVSYVTEYARNIKDSNDQNIIPLFVCYWNDSIKGFTMSTNSVNVPLVMANTYIMGTAMKIVANEGAIIEITQSQNPNNLQEQIYAVKDTANITNAILINNDTINKANTATQELSSSDDSVEITYTGRNADLKTKGGSMNTKIGYKQYKWNDLTANGYTVSTINEQIIPLSSIKDVILNETQYSNNLQFSITSLIKSQLIGSNQYYAFMGLINTNKTNTTKRSYYQGAIASSWSTIQQAVATDPFIWIYWKYNEQTIPYKVELTALDVNNIATFVNKITNTIKQQYAYMSSFVFDYDSNDNKFYMKINNQDVIFNISKCFSVKQ